MEYRQHNSEMWRLISLHDTKDMAGQTIQISDLRPSTEYIIRLSINGSNGNTVSKEYNIKTKGLYHFNSYNFSISIVDSK